MKEAGRYARRGGFARKRPSLNSAPMLLSPSPFMLLSPLGERLGEGVMQEAIFVLHPSPSLCDAY
jgi:hypothetical protein